MNKLYYIPIIIIGLIVANTLLNPSGLQALKGFKMPFRKDEFNSSHTVSNGDVK